MFKFIKNWLDRLAKENEKNFGTDRLDCCGLNKPKNTNTQSSNSNTDMKWSATIGKIPNEQLKLNKSAG